MEIKEKKEEKNFNNNCKEATRSRQRFKISAIFFRWDI